MRARRFSARTTPGQVARRTQWAAYSRDGRWWARRRAWLTSPAPNAHCPGCGQPVGPSDDVHHLAYPAVPGPDTDTDLLLLCRACHETVHTSIDVWPGLRRMSRRHATWTVLNQLYQTHHEGETP